MNKGLILLFFLSFYGCAFFKNENEKIVKMDSIKFLNGVGFIVNKPYSGNVEGFYSNGTRRLQGKLVNGKEHGFVLQWDESGNLVSKAEFNNGILDGKTIEYWPNERMKYLFNYEDGNKNGKYVQWYESGQKQVIGSYKNDLMQGVLVEWYSNGTKKSETTYKNGLAHGDFVLWNEEGVKLVEGKYKNDLKTGEWFIYDSKGFLKSIQIFKDGKLMNTTKN